MKVFRILIVALVLFGLLVYAGPWLLYGVGLAMIDGKPSPSAQATPINQVQREYLQRELRSEQALAVERLSPWSYICAVASGKNPNSQVAWLVARNYVANHRKARGNLSWHLSGAALTVWLTRHWSNEQLLVRLIGVAAEEKWRSYQRFSPMSVPPLRSGTTAG